MRPFSARYARFEPIDKVWTPSYLSVISSQARPAGRSMLRIARVRKAPVLKARPARRDRIANDAELRRI
jgi:hypothetical protein